MAAKAEFRPVIDWLAIGPGTLRRVASASLALYAGTMDFCALHALTGSHWLRVLWLVLPDPDLALRHFWQAIAALYPKIGFPDLPSRGDAARLARTPLPGVAGNQGLGREEVTMSTISASPSRPLKSGASTAIPLYRYVAARRAPAHCVTDTVLAEPFLPTAAASISRSKAAGSPRSSRVGNVADADDRSRQSAARRPGSSTGTCISTRRCSACPSCRTGRRSSIAERIARERELRRELAYPVEARARHLIDQVVVHGTTALRTHVDIDAEVGLTGLQALLAVTEEARDLIDIQIVAFPQSGILADPGTADFLDQAILEGADLVGGLDPAGIDDDVTGHLDAIFGIAERRGVGLDIHLHDPGPLGCFELRQIASRTLAAGLRRTRRGQPCVCAGRRR